MSTSDITTDQQPTAENGTKEDVEMQEKEKDAPPQEPPRVQFQTPKGDEEEEPDGEEYFPNPDKPKNESGESGELRKSKVMATGSFDYDAMAKKKTFAEVMTSGDNVGRLRRETAVPIDFVINYLQLSLDASALYNDLFVFIPFLVLFTLFFLYGQKVESNFYVLKGIRDQLTLTEFPTVENQLENFRTQILMEDLLWIEPDKRYFDIGNDGDWGDWLKDVVVSTTWDCANKNVSHQVLAPFGQNYHLGAMRIRTLRMPPDSCTVKDDIYPNDPDSFPRTCYATHKRTLEQKGQLCNFTNPINGDPLFMYKECEDVPGVYISAVEGVYHCGGFTFEIPFNATCEQAMALAELATDSTCKFTNDWATRFVVVEYFIYSPSTDAFHAVKMYSEVLPGGWWYNQYMYRSFQMWTPRLQAQSIITILFIIFVIYYWVYFFIDLIVHFRSDAPCIGFFIEFWNILEMVNLATFLAVFVLKFMWFKTSQDADNIKFPFAAEYPKNLDKLMALQNSTIYANSINTILTFLKLLKYVRLNSRLSVLTRTISQCQQSIFGVLVLFVFVILGYGITAWTLFGINIEGFRNLGVAMSTLIRMLVGDIDYEAMRRENRFLAGAFFWTFVILALFLLLNFLIAIISEAFAKISGKAFAQNFDELVMRSYQHFKAVLACHNIKRMCRECCSGHNEAKMLRLALKDLEVAKATEITLLNEARQAQLDVLRASGDFDKADDVLDEDEIVIQMMRADWNKWVDPETFEHLGDFFFDYTWDEIMNEYDDHRKASEEVSKRHMQETVKAGVEKVVGDELKKVDQLDEMLSQLEEEIEVIKSTLEKRRQ